MIDVLGRCAAQQAVGVGLDEQLAQGLPLGIVPTLGTGRALCVGGLGSLYLTHTALALLDEPATRT
jgi:putative NADH-flavin reductase